MQPTGRRQRTRRTRSGGRSRRSGCSVGSFARFCRTTCAVAAGQRACEIWTTELRTRPACAGKQQICPRGRWVAPACGTRPREFVAAIPTSLRGAKSDLPTTQTKENKARGGGGGRRKGRRRCCGGLSAAGSPVLRSADNCAAPAASQSRSIVTPYRARSHTRHAVTPTHSPPHSPAPAFLSFLPIASGRRSRMRMLPCVSLQPT